jgi:hypothetical protein
MDDGAVQGKSFRRVRLERRGGMVETGGGVGDRETGVTGGTPGDTTGD